MSTERRHPFPETPGIVRCKAEGSADWSYTCSGCEMVLRVKLGRAGVAEVQRAVHRFKSLHAGCRARGAA